MRRAPEILLTDDELGMLERWAQGRSTPYRVVLRSRIVLMAARGIQNKDIAVALGTTPNTVGRWRRRFAEKRLAGIEKDAPRGEKQLPGGRAGGDIPVSH